MTLKPIYLTAIAALSLVLSCNSSADKAERSTELGQLGYRFSGNEAAIPHFEQGLLLLHSFEYEDARASFQRAIEADPEMAMAYWGEAMSYYKALWGRQDTEKGRAVLARLGDNPAQRARFAAGELEKGFLESAEILFGEGTDKERQKAYADYLEDLYNQYPDNQELAAFYALSLLWTSDRQEDNFRNEEKSARIVQSILEENPEHPGALHYMIHAYDNPELAAKALDAADAYGEVAPSAAHALHMPSHIYVAMGMWDEVVASNERAYQASLDRAARREAGEDPDLHSYQWLMYGYLQQGRYREAEQIMRNLIDMYPRLSSRLYANEYMARMRGAFQVESCRWDHQEIAEAPIDISRLNIFMKAMHYYSVGYRAFKQKDADQLSTVITELQEAIRSAEMLVSGDAAATMCSAPGLSRYAPTKNGVLSAKVVLAELQAVQSMWEKDKGRTEQLLKQAVTWELETNYSFGPPRILKPAPELYGEWLLREGRADEALYQFDQALERAPRRVMTLRGKRQALEMLGMKSEAEEVEGEIAAIWHRADPEVKATISRDDRLTFR